MNYFRFCLFMFVSLNATACPNIKQIQVYLSEGKVSGVKEAAKCGFDLHKEGDKALYIAQINSQFDLVEFLRASGLKDNAEYIQNAWLRDLYRSKALGATISLYELDTRKRITSDSWAIDLEKYAISRGEKANSVSDAWGRKFLYKGRSDDISNPHIICSLGRDGKVGGELYDKDICSNDDIKSLKFLLNEIGYF